MPQLNDATRSLAALEQETTLIAVIEMSQSSWLVAGLVPGIERHPMKKLEPDEGALLRLLQRWQDEAVGVGGTITRIAVAYEAGRDPGEGLELADDEVKGPGLFGGIAEGHGLGLKLGEPRLELRLFDEPLGVTVDEATDAAPEVREPAIDRLTCEPARAGSRRFQPSPVLQENARAGSTVLGRPRPTPPRPGARPPQPGRRTGADRRICGFRRCRPGIPK